MQRREDEELQSGQRNMGLQLLRKPVRKVFTRAKPRSHQLLGGIKGMKEVEETKCEVSAAGSCEDFFFFC